MSIRRMAAIVVVASGVAIAGCASAPSSPAISEMDRSQIQAALDASLNGWNEGSLAKHLSLY